MQWRYKEKQNGQEHHEKFFHLADSYNGFLLFFRKHLLQFLCCLLCYLLKSFIIFTGKHLCLSLFLIKFQDWTPAFSFKKRFQQRCFSVNIVKFLRTVFLWKTCSLYLSNILVDDRYWYFRLTSYYFKLRFYKDL